MTQYNLNCLFLLLIFIFNIKTMDNRVDNEETNEKIHKRINFISFLVEKSLHALPTDALYGLLRDFKQLPFSMEYAYANNQSDENKIQLEQIFSIFKLPFNNNFFEDYVNKYLIPCNKKTEEFKKNERICF